MNEVKLHKVRLGYVGLKRVAFSERETERKPPWEGEAKILTEDGGYMLTENGGAILLESGIKMIRLTPRKSGINA